MMSMTTVVTIRDPPPEWKCSDFAGFRPDSQGFAWSRARPAGVSRAPRAIPTEGPGWPSRCPSVGCRT
jgi:hypothetical protein